MYINIQNANYFPINIFFWIPQSSILEPLLLCIYVNDSKNAIFTVCFGDDICLSNKSLDSLQTLGNYELNIVYVLNKMDWF